MIKRIKTWFKSHIDYKITREYYDVTKDHYGREVYVRKYKRRYYWKK